MKGSPVRRSVADLIILADDLSGAAESAAAVASGAHLPGVPVLLGAHDPDVDAIASMSPIVIDTNSRSTQADRLDDVFAPLIPLLAQKAVAVKKVDSLLRGNFAAEIEALRPLDRPVIVAPALPAAGRIVRDGVVIVDGLPLSQTPAWSIEPVAPPKAIQKSFSTHARLLPLEVVRSGDAFVEALHAALSRPSSIVVCDGETADDLRVIARAALEFEGAEPLLVGASALVAAVAELLAPASPPAPAGVSGSDAPTRMVFVVGTAEPSAQRQVARLERAGATVARLSPSQLVADATSARDAIAAAVEHRLSVVTFDLAEPFDANHGPRLADALADAVARTIPLEATTALFLTGGHTARTILDALGIEQLTVTGPIDLGAARGVTASGVAVVTRPGSFGSDDSLFRIAAEMLPPHLTDTSSDEGHTT